MPPLQKNERSKESSDPQKMTQTSLALTAQKMEKVQLAILKRESSLEKLAKKEDSFRGESSKKKRTKKLPSLHFSVLKKKKL